MSWPSNFRSGSPIRRETPVGGAVHRSHSPVGFVPTSPGEQDFENRHIHRLLHIPEAAQFMNGFECFFDAPECSHHNRRGQSARGSQSLSAIPKPSTVRHHRVGQQDIDAGIGDDVEGLLPVARLTDFVPPAAYQNPERYFPILLVVVCYENSHIEWRKQLWP